MKLYSRMVAKLGPRAANVLVVLGRAALIVAVVMLSDKGFTSFPYMQVK
jgi:hypothetical protein